MRGPRDLRRPEAPRRIPERATLRRHAQALRVQAIQTGRRARRELVLLVPVVAALVVAYLYRVELFGVDRPARLVLAVAMVILGWVIAADLGRALQPRLVRRVDPGAAGVEGFLVRLLALIAIVLASLRLAGLQPRTLVLGASFTAVIVGLAAQQTVGNVIAGVVLLSARPFQIGDRVRFNGFGMDVEGTVAGHGLLYLTLTDGDDLVMVPNNTALAMSNRPLREPAAVDMLARLPLGVDPEAVEARVSDTLSVETRGPLRVTLEEVDGDEIVVRIRAIPVDDHLGGRLSRELLEAVSDLRAQPVGDGEPSAASESPKVRS